MMELLLMHGARSLAKDEAGGTAKSIADSKRDREIVQLLFNYEAEPDVWTTSKTSRIPSEVVEFRHIAMVCMILSKGW